MKTREPSSGPVAQVSVSESLESLWISGLVLLILFSVRLFHLSGERFDWTEYLLLGTLFPALLVALSLLDRSRPGLASLRIIKRALSVLVILLPLVFLRVTHFKYIVIVSLAQSLVAWRLFKQLTTEALACSSVRMFIQFAVVLFVILTSWAIASKYVWGQSYDEFILASNVSFLVFVASFALVLVSVYDWTTDIEESNPTVKLVGNLFAILIIAMASVRTDRIFGVVEMFHSISFAGPAESVRQGGWLLWDVPSHYGFLSVLTLAWLPTKTVWGSLFLVNALFNFLIALMIFGLFRSLRPGFLNLCLALAVTLAAVFFRYWPQADYFYGPNHLPNIGGLRFFWCFVLVAILFWEYRYRKTAKRWCAHVLWAGSVVWLIGVLWSAESAVYCSVIWFPPLAFLSWQKTAQLTAKQASFSHRLRDCARWFSIPFALLLITVIFIFAIYLFRLGHAPDWRSYFEYASAYSGGFMAMPIDAGGEVWVLILIFCAFVTTAAYLFRESRGNHAALPLIFSAGGGFWATASYFVSRSHPNNAHNLSAIFCGVIGLTLYLLVRERKTDLWSLLVRSSLVPVLTVVVVVVFASKAAVKDYVTASEASYMEIERLIPISDPSLDTLLNSSQVKPDDPIVFIGENDLRVFSGWTYADGDKQVVQSTYRSWMTIPLYSFVPLKDERRITYMSRFGQRTHMSGWLIEHKNPQPVYPWFSEYLRLHYTSGKSFENANWKLTWYDYRS